MGEELKDSSYWLEIVLLRLVLSPVQTRCTFFQERSHNTTNSPTGDGLFLTCMCPESSSQGLCYQDRRLKFHPTIVALTSPESQSSR